MNVKSSVILAEDWNFSVDQTTILENLSFSISKGDFVSIVGPNGAGKTTLLKCLMRINRGGRGTLCIEGLPVRDYDQRALARKISYVPQSGPMRLPYTVQQFVSMGRYPYHSVFSPSGSEDERKVADALTKTGLLEFRNRMMESLSGGERQKAFIAAALAQETDILLLDEPSAFLDPRHEDDLYRLLSRLNKETGVTLLVVTHDINHAAQMSDRILAMKSGSLVFSGVPEDFMVPEVLESLFDKEFLFVSHPRTRIPVVVSDVWR